MVQHILFSQVARKVLLTFLGYKLVGVLARLCWDSKNECDPVPLTDHEHSDYTKQTIHLHRVQLERVHDVKVYMSVV